MSAREDILDRIGRALSDRPQPADVPRTYRGAGERQVEDLVELFAETVTDYRAQVTTCSAAELPTVLADRLARQGISSVVIDPGLPRAWLSEADVAIRIDAPPLAVAELDAVDGIVTNCRCGIAVTGTIVLDHDSGQGRRALTLVPDFHLIVIDAEQIVANVPDAIAVLDPTRPQTWISGPSATSDIELDRVEGVHGPRRLEIIIVRTEP